PPPPPPAPAPAAEATKAKATKAKSTKAKEAKPKEDKPKEAKPKATKAKKADAADKGEAPAKPAAAAAPPPPPPPAATKKAFVLKDDKSDKFWDIELKGKTVTVTFGKSGTKGQTKPKDFADEAAAKKEYDKLVTEKVKKGYTEKA